MERTSAAFERNETNTVRDSLIKAGLSDVEAPRPGTKAYERLISAAERYIAEVKKGETSQISLPYADSENYFSRRKASPSSDSVRREYHNLLSGMLLGNLRKELSKKDADGVSDFAAYVTGHEEYVGTW